MNFPIRVSYEKQKTPQQLIIIILLQTAWLQEVTKSYKVQQYTICEMRPFQRFSLFWHLTEVLIFSIPSTYLFTSGPFKPGSSSCFEPDFPNVSLQSCREPWLCELLHAVLHICIQLIFRYQVYAAEGHRLHLYKAVSWWLDRHKEIKATLYGHWRQKKWRAGVVFKV